VAANTGYRNYPTPRASEHKGVGPLGSKSHEAMLDKKYLGATVQEVGQKTGQLNPEWVEWLMGWPWGWTSSDELYGLYWPSWSADPHPMPPRTARGIKDRVSRLKALGNGIVPQTLYMAFCLLMGYVTTSNEKGTA